MSETMMQASAQWASRPADQRFTSLTSLAAYKKYQKQRSRDAVIPNRKISLLPAAPESMDIRVKIESPRKDRDISYVVDPTHWAFGQLCARASVPAGYMRSGLTGGLIADCLNWGLHCKRSVEDCQILFGKRDDDSMELRAVTGPDYGRIWDADIADSLVRNFGDGINGAWRVPGEFGQRVEITKQNTTLYASDSDMWVFLADEDHRIEIPNGRDGHADSLARGFYIGNSEVGKSPLVFGMFLYRYVCCNRIIWGAEQHREVRIIHRSGAPDRWLEEVLPILDTYANAPAMPVEATLKAAQATKIRNDVTEFLATRFGKGSAELIKAAHVADEQRPIETIWDAVNGATAYARGLTYQDDRIAVERIAGGMLRTVQRELVPIAA